MFTEAQYKAHIAIKYWADVSKYKDKAGNLTGERVAPEGKLM